jgi:DNA-directed RNA polymerase subunit M/transcription elongation factor TFIIS
MSLETGENRVSSPADGGQDNPPPKQQQQSNNTEPRHCKKCRAVLGLGTVTTRFGDQPAYEGYVCAACGFIGWVAIA